MNEKCPTPLALLAGLPSVEAHVEGCATCRNRLLELEADRKAFLAQHPFSSFWNAVEGRHPPSALARFWRQLTHSGVLRTAAAMASVAALMILVFGRYDRAPEVRTKGGVGIQFYVAPTGEGDAERGRNGMSLPEGSEIQFLYTAQEPYLLFVGVEADRTLTVYHPFGGSKSVAIEKGDQKKLPQALRWEPKTAYERFYAVFSKAPVSVEDVKKALEGLSIDQTAKLPLPYPQASVILFRE